MFNNLVESTGVRRGGRTARIFVGTVVVWSITLAAAVVVGIVAFDARVSADFEKDAMMSAVVPVPPPPPPPVGARTAHAVREAVPEIGFTSRATEPTSIPEPSTKPPTVGTDTGIGIPTNAIGHKDGIVDGKGEGWNKAGNGPNVDGPDVIPPPPPAPEAVVERPKAPIVSRRPLTGQARHRVQPPYPPTAKAAGIQGAVVVEITMDERGNVIGSRVVSGHPLLREAALSASWGWKFTPTTINEVPVKVIGTITFNFKLGS